MPWDNAKKYIGGCCGNTFVILDCRNIQLKKEDKINFSKLYIKKYSVDSALIINNHETYDLFLEIFEQDGSESESCGNGLILVADLLQMKNGRILFGNSVFVISHGPETHIASIDTGFISVQKQIANNSLFVKVGEPHLIYFVDDIKKFDLINTGQNAQYRYKNGVNVDAIQKIDDFHYLIRTYRRGVNAETKSCGTGSMSSYFAICYLNDKMNNQSIDIKSAGGEHWVSMEKNILSLEVLTEFCYVESLNDSD
jgi:diaminopimelate epimerase